MALTVEIENHGAGSYLIRPEGRLDADTAISFEKKIDPLLVRATVSIIFNLEKLTYLSSAGVRVIFKARKALAAHNAAFILTNLQPQIRKVFEIINALPEASVFVSVQEADRYLDAMQKEEVEKQRRIKEAADRGHA